jgi:hypothetical protein
MNAAARVGGSDVVAGRGGLIRGGRRREVGEARASHRVGVLILSHPGARIAAGTTLRASRPSSSSTAKACNSSRLPTDFPDNPECLSPPVAATPSPARSPEWVN